jgi:alpha-tubulin suppressor-like RCC1 family protein
LLTLLPFAALHGCIDEPFGASPGHVDATWELGTSVDTAATSTSLVGSDENTQASSSTASSQASSSTSSGESLNSASEVSTSIETSQGESSASTTEPVTDSSDVSSTNSSASDSSAGDSSESSSATTSSTASDSSETSSDTESGDFERAIDIAVGGAHSCAINDDGDVRCWGDNSEGQLAAPAQVVAIGDDEVAAQAPLLHFDRPATSVVAGDGHTCVILEGGSVRCWGRNQDGQLGLGLVSADQRGAADTWNTDVDLGGKARMLAAGDDHTCALLTSGEVTCWGDGSAGQLGYGSTKDVGKNESPREAGVVEVVDHRPALAIACGGAHTCALFAEGDFQCWGQGKEGALGTGDLESIGNIKKPSAYSTIRLDAKVVALALGFRHTCAFFTSGETGCWGNNQWAQLGRGDLEPEASSAHARRLTFASSPTRIDRGKMGSGHTCIVLADGGVQCWGTKDVIGSGNHDTYGDDELGSSVLPLTLPGAVTKVTSSFRHTCALGANGKIICWGSADAGQLGYGNKHTIGDDESVASTGWVPISRH